METPREKLLKLCKSMQYELYVLMSTLRTHVDSMYSCRLYVLICTPRTHVDSTYSCVLHVRMCTPRTNVNSTYDMYAHVYSWKCVNLHLKKNVLSRSWK